MSILLDLAMFPTDKGESVSKYVSEVIKVIKESGYPYVLTPMGTIIEFETFEEATDLLNKCYKVLEPLSNRIYVVCKFDIRKGKSNRIKQKIESVKKHIGEVSSL